MTSADLAAITALEREAFGAELHESEEAFRRLIELFPDGALGSFDDEGLCGFAFGVPLVAGATLDLGKPLAAIPDGADTFYVHDVAVARRCRGLGVGRALAERLLDAARARGFARAELVSVQGSAPFWAQFGFREVARLRYGQDVPSVKMAARL